MGGVRRMQIHKCPTILGPTGFGQGMGTDL